MNMCYNCLKISNFGHLVSHAKNKVSHERKPNLHRAHVLVDGIRMNVKLCTKCMRTVHRAKTITAKAN